MEKPKINYPCDWSYKIIGSDKELIAKTIPTVLENGKYKFYEGNQSKTGKYTSFNLSVHVDSEEKRDKIFNLLKNIPTVIMIL